MLLQILRDLCDVTRSTQRNTYPEAKVLLHVFMWMALQPRAQKTRNASDRAFSRYRRKDRNRAPCLRQQIFRERTAHNLDSTQLIGKKKPSQDTSALRFALRGMQLHHKFVPGGQRQIGQRWENIAIKAFGAAAGYLVKFGEENNVWAKLPMIRVLMGTRKGGQSGTANLDLLRRHATSSHQVVLLHFPFHPNDAAVAPLEQIAGIERPMMAGNAGKSAFAGQQQRNPGIRVAIIGAEHPLHRFAIENILPRIANFNSVPEAAGKGLEMSQAVQNFKFRDAA